MPPQDALFEVPHSLRLVQFCAEVFAKKAAKPRKEGTRVCACCSC